LVRFWNVELLAQRPDAIIQAKLELHPFGVKTTVMGQEPPRRLDLGAAEVLPKAAAPVVRQRVSCGLQTSILKSDILLPSQ
jgi:hypothetical protein